MFAARSLKFLEICRKFVITVFFFIRRRGAAPPRPNRIHLAQYHQSVFGPFHDTAEKNFDKAISLFVQGNSTVRKKAFPKKCLFFLSRRTERN
jgi:hypothetical protein